MNSVWGIALALIAVCGCKKKDIDTPVPETQVVYPDLHCPEGARAAGAPPPQGTEVWCLKQNPDGSVVRQGPAIRWHANEQRRATGDYQDDKKYGMWMYWYPTGKPEMQGSYVRGVEDGTWVSYHPSGDKASEGNKVDGKEHGRWVYWSDGGLSRTEGAWVLGERDGVWFDYGPDGQPLRERIYRQGRMISHREL